jgi:hypothetical protein
MVILTNMGILSFCNVHTYVRLQWLTDGGQRIFVCHRLEVHFCYSALGDQDNLSNKELS